MLGISEKFGESTMIEKTRPSIGTSAHSWATTEVAGVVTRMLGVWAEFTTPYWIRTRGAGQMRKWDGKSFAKWEGRNKWICPVQFQPLILW